MAKVYRARNTFLGFGLGTVILLVLSNALSGIFGPMNTVFDRYGELQGQMILNFNRMGPTLAMLFCVNGAQLAARQASIVFAIVSALWLSMLGLLGTLPLAVLDAIVFRASMLPTMERFMWGLAFGGVVGVFWGWLFGVFNRVDQKGRPFTLAQFLQLLLIINRHTCRAALVGMAIGMYLVAAILFVVVGYGYLGIMMGLAATAVVAIILVNKFNSTNSISGGHDGR